MARDIKESDWKLLNRLKPIAIERYCQKVLSEVGHLLSDAKSAHERYLAIFAIIQERDSELGNCFNDLRRSNAFVSLAMMRSLDLVSDEEFAGFSAETQSIIELFTR